MLETHQGLEVDHPVLQKAELLWATVDTVMCHLPLPGEDHIILLDGILDHIGRCQDLLTMLLGVGLDMTDLCCMSSPFHLSIIHL